MGPYLIFDKSFLQSLSLDESVWLDMFFNTCLVPPFYAETLGDLDKQNEGSSDPESVVAALSDKTPDMSMVPCADFRTILAYEVSTKASFDLQCGRPVQTGGRAASDGESEGVFYDQSPEAKALNRWLRKDFSGLERALAKNWRCGIAGVSPSEQRNLFGGWFGDRRPSSLSEVKDAAIAYIDGQSPESVLRFGLDHLGYSMQIVNSVIDIWQGNGSPNILEYVPYFRHVLSVELFFYLARSADLISDRKSNIVDISYMHYLPFCMVFVSRDKLHRKCCPLFMRDNQSFVWGDDLKADLAALDRHYSGLPESIRAKGLHYFASSPPHDKTYFVTRLWDKHMRRDWRERRSLQGKDSVSKDASSIIDRVLASTNQSSQVKAFPSVFTQPAGFVSRRQVIKAQKGKWNRLPRS